MQNMTPHAQLANDSNGPGPLKRMHIKNLNFRETKKIYKFKGANLKKCGVIDTACTKIDD
jgi:hypothetical protein